MLLYQPSEKLIFVDQSLLAIFVAIEDIFAKLHKVVQRLRQKQNYETEISHIDAIALFYRLPLTLLTSIKNKILEQKPLIGQALCPFLCLCVQKFKKMDTD